MKYIICWLVFENRINRSRTFSWFWQFWWQYTKPVRRDKPAKEAKRHRFLAFWSNYKSSQCLLRWWPATKFEFHSFPVIKVYLMNVRDRLLCQLLPSSCPPSHWKKIGFPLLHNYRQDGWRLLLVRNSWELTSSGRSRLDMYWGPNIYLWW